jgi:hypothetical protein
MQISRKSADTNTISERGLLSDQAPLTVCFKYGFI